MWQQRELVMRGGAEHEPPIRRHRIHGVENQAENNLPELHRIEKDRQ